MSGEENENQREGESTPSSSHCSHAHTLGPWSVTPKYFDEHGEALQQIEAESHMLAEVYVCDGEEGEANARLMAAAPDLLVACHEAIIAIQANLVFAGCKDEHSLMKAFLVCKNAIQDATGHTSGARQR